MATGSDQTSFASPLVIENYVRAWTGSLGMHALRTVDQSLTFVGAVPAKVEPTPTMADLPVIRAFASRYPSASVQSIQDFYDTAEERKRARDTVRYLSKTGQPEAAATEREDRNLATADRIQRTLGLQSRLIRGIYRNQTMSAEDKRELIDNTYLQMIEIARAGNRLFEQTDRQKRKAREVELPTERTPD